MIADRQWNLRRLAVNPAAHEDTSVYAVIWITYINLVPSEDIISRTSFMTMEGFELHVVLRHTVWVSRWQEHPQYPRP